METTFKRSGESLIVGKAQNDSMQIGKNILIPFDTLNNLVRIFVSKKNEIANLKILSSQLEKQIDSYKVEIYK